MRLEGLPRPQWPQILGWDTNPRFSSHLLTSWSPLSQNNNKKVFFFFNKKKATKIFSTFGYNSSPGGFGRELFFSHVETVVPTNLHEVLHEQSLRGYLICKLSTVFTLVSGIWNGNVFKYFSNYNDGKQLQKKGFHIWRVPRLPRGFKKQTMFYIVVTLWFKHTHYTSMYTIDQDWKKHLIKIKINLVLMIPLGWTKTLCKKYCA